MTTIKTATVLPVTKPPCAILGGAQSWCDRRTGYSASASRASAVGLALVLSGVLALAATNPPARDTAATLLRLQAQLDEQTSRLDRLFDAIGPHLAEMEERAAALKKQNAEDTALAMKEVLRTKDEALTDRLIFLPQSPLLAVATSDRTVRLVSLRHGIGDTTLTGLDSSAISLAASADGKKVFAGTQTGSIFVWQENHTNAQKVFDWKNWPVTALAVSPDGTLLVCACNGRYGTNQAWIKPDESLLAIEVASGTKLWSGQAGRSDFQTVSFARDGKTLAVVQGGLVAVIEAQSGRILHKLEHEKYGPLSTVLSRDGKLCAAGYAPNNVGIWDVGAGKCLRLLGAHSNWVVALAFSPDGSRLATSAGDTTASVWEVLTGKEVGRLRFGDGAAYVNSISISDDGRWLAAGRRGEYVVLEMPRLKPADQTEHETR